MCAVGVCAQAPATSPCTMDAPTFNTGAADIFNDRQEQDLGDALAEYFESDLKIAPPAANDELTRIGEKLLATLPPTGIHFRFRIYESGEVNGFSLAGGRVYISRKMIAAVKNEDELAGVVAHELGHLTTHQTAIEMSRAFRIRLGITEVGDRSDVFAKVHQFLSTPEKSQEGEEKEEKDQLVADRVALYALVKAGYAPESFASFLNESMNNKGKTGNWLTDAFGLTHEESQRYRTALKMIAALPEGCKGKQPTADVAFLDWQKQLVTERTRTSAEGATGDRPLRLEPLRPSLWRIKFSPDGRYVLAQDEGTISIVDRGALKVLFQIEAPEANQAQFAPDSKSVLFYDDNLRFERWDIASGKRIWVKELVLYDGCRQSFLSQDGRTLMCANMRDGASGPLVDLRMIDVESGNTIFEKKNFYDPGGYYGLTYLLELEGALGVLVDLHDSPDGRYVIITHEDKMLAWDFEQRAPVALGGKLKGLRDPRMSFLGPDQLIIAGDFNGKMWKADLVSFPDGKMVGESQIGIQQMRPVTKGKLLAISPVKDYAVALYDPQTMKVVSAWKLPTVDVWDKFISAEGTDGRLQFGELGKPELTGIPLPLGPLPNPQALAFSPDGKYLAVSLRTRGAMWDLETGKQIYVMRPMEKGWFDGEDHLWAQCPKYMDRDPSAVEMSIEPRTVKDLGKYEAADIQYRNLQIRFKPINSRDSDTGRHVTLTMKKMGSEAVLWTRDYQKERPAVWGAEDDRLILAWDLASDAAKGEIKTYPALERETGEYKNRRGLLLEIVKPESGEELAQVIVPEVDITRGRFDERSATVSGDYVLARGEHDNTDIYRITDGSKVGEFFGFPVATDAKDGIVASVNREEEILLVDEHTGRELERFTLGSPVRTARFVAGKGTLMVLTADQQLHRMPLPKTDTTTTATAQN